MSTIIRPVGDLERFSTSRHNLGIYRCVAGTARYTTSTASEDLPKALSAALAKVIFRHGALCCGIINEDKNDPAFIRLESIDISKCMEFRDIKASSMEEHEKGVIENLERTHSELFPNIETLPPWKLIILQSPALLAKGSGFDAIFAFHHALGCGVSGMVFHRTLLSALNEGTTGSEISSDILAIPDTITLTPAMEKCIKFKISWFFLLKQLWPMFKPTWLFPASALPWTSTPISAANISAYKSRVKISTFPPTTITPILAACRSQKATLTGLLHGLVVASFSARVPHAASFTSSTPLSLRHLTGLSPTGEIAVQVAGHSMAFDSQTLTPIREARTPEKLTEQVWNIALKFRASMAEEIARLPNDNIIALIPYISNLHQFFLSKIGKHRDNTYEVSNVGTLKTESGGKWKIDRAVFTQSGMGTGAAVGVNMVSVAGGETSISFTWLYGDIDDELVDGLMKDVEFGLRCIAEGKEVSIGL